MRLGYRTPLMTIALRATALGCIVASLTPVSAWGGQRAGARRLDVPLWDSTGVGGYSAMLEQCVPSKRSEGRSVTFTGQMTAVSGTQRMAMRIVLQERTSSAGAFRDVSASGLGVWRDSEAGVKIYRYVKQITDLSAPAVYRALVRFRWLGENGRVVRRAILRTATCAQPTIG